MFKEITPKSLPHDASIVVVACGKPAFIDFWKNVTRCPFPIYVDPTGKIYSTLNLEKEWSKFTYSYLELFRVFVKSMSQAIRHVPYRMLLETDPEKMVSGDPRQQGGEFLFEKNLRGEKTVTWCRRAASGYDHTPGIEIAKKLGAKSNQDS